MRELNPPLDLAELHDLLGLLCALAKQMRDDGPTGPLWITIRNVEKAIDDADAKEAEQPVASLPAPRDPIERDYYYLILGALERRLDFRIAARGDRHELARSLASCIAWPV